VLVVFDFQYLDHVSFPFSPSLPVISKISVTSKVAADDVTIARKLPPSWSAGHLRARSLRRLQQVVRAEAHAVGDAHAVILIRTEEVCHLAFDDLAWHALHRLSHVVEQLRLLVRAHEPEEVASLAIIVVAVTMIVTVRVARNRKRRLLDARILHRPPSSSARNTHRGWRGRKAAFCRRHDKCAPGTAAC
jgi:hypothetical protein